MKDWWGRSKDSGYIAKTVQPRINWGRAKGSSFYGAIRDVVVDVNVYKDAYTRANHIRSIMELPSTAKVELSRETSCTIFDSNFKQLICGASMLDSETTALQNMDAFLGQVCVSAGYAMHGESFTLDSGIKSVLQAIIEEERIIRRVLREYPGYEDLISEYKKYKFRKHEFAPAHTPAYKILHTIKHLVQWPEYVDTQVLETYPALFSEIQKVLREFKDTFGFSDDKAREIANIIREYIHDPEAFEDKHQPEGSGDDFEENESGAEGGLGTSSKENPDNSEKSNKGTSEKEEEGSRSGSLPGSSEESEGESKEEQAKKAARAHKERNYLKGDLDSLKKECAALSREYRKQSESSRRLSETQALKIQGEMRTEDNVNYIKMRDDREAYEAARATIAPHILPLVNTFSKFMQTTQYKLSGMRRGVLDTNKLAEAYQNVETVFSNKIIKESSALDVCLLIDQSGSMYGSKIKTARAAAILLNEVFYKLPKCRFFISGHSADEDDQETVIRVFRDDWNKNKYSLGKCHAHSNNRDHEAIQKVHQLVRKQTSNPLLMFVISDGAPAARGIYSASDGARKVREVVNSIEKKNNTIICQISIEEHLDWRTMFNYGIKLTNMDTFASDLSQYILKTLISKLKIEEK